VNGGLRERFVSCCPQSAILPLFPRRLQFPIPLGLNLLLMPGERVLRRDGADGAVQTYLVVMLDVTKERFLASLGMTK
jgi:hypothetical protein